MDAKYFKFGTVGTTLINGLLSYWKLDENSSTQSDSVGDNDLTVTGATYNATGKISKCLDYTTNTDYSMDTTATFSFPSDKLTISMWVNLDAVSQIGAYFIRLANSSDSSGIYIVVDADNRFQLSVKNSGGTTYSARTTTEVPTTSWTHVVAICNGDGQNHSFYINGSGVSVSNATAFSGVIRNDATRVYLGNYGNGDTYAPIGLIDEVGIWNRALSSTEVTELYNSGNGKSHPFA